MCMVFDGDTIVRRGFGAYKKGPQWAYARAVRSRSMQNATVRVMCASRLDIASRGGTPLIHPSASASAWGLGFVSWRTGDGARAGMDSSPAASSAHRATNTAYQYIVFMDYTSLNHQLWIES
jgi:hypothetical protein